MSLTISKIHTRCRASSTAPVTATQLLRVAHQHLPTACRQVLAARWPAHEQIVRIRRLPLKLRLPRTDLHEEQIARAWAEALAQALWQALAYPTGAGAVEIVRAENRAAWLARFLTDLVQGRAQERWEYEEFQACFALPVEAAALAVLRGEPHEAVAVLLQLEANNALPRLLDRWDELALEELFRLVAQARGSVAADLEAADLLTIGHLVRTLPPTTSSWLQSPRRQTALWLFLKLLRAADTATAARWTPRRVWQAVLCLRALLLLTQHRSLPELTGTVLQAELAQRASALPEFLQARLAEMLEMLARDAQATTQLTALLDDLRSALPAAQKPNARVIDSECAGLFLLIGLLQRHDWPQQFRHLGAEQHTLRYSLAALGLALLDRYEPAPTRLDAGLALFAGWENEADLSGWRQFLATDAHEPRRVLLQSLIGTDDGAESWEATLAALADWLSHEFANRARGLHHASRSFLIQNIFALPGTIQVDKTRLTVRLVANPYHIALHVSGVDAPVENVSWLAGRNVEFHLAGL